MKKLFRITVGVAAIMFAVTGFCIGQTVTTKTNDLTNKADKSSGHSVSTTKEDANEARKQAAIKARRGGASEAQVQQLLRRLKDQEDSKQKAVEVYLTDFKEPVKDEITIKRNRSLGFQNESKPSEVKITMTDEYNYLGISIRSKFIKGIVMVEIFDPKGDKKGTYTLKTEETVVLGDNTSSGEQVTGEFDKYFKLPINGEWIIRAVPTSASGTIELTLTQKYIKRTDTF